MQRIVQAWCPVTTCCEHTTGICGCACFNFPRMNTGVNVMCHAKNAVKHVGINIF